TLVGRGLLQPVSRTRVAARPGAGTTIDALAIVTAGRPAALERSLHSYVQHLSECGRTPSILVFDASARALDTERAQALVAQAREGTDRDVRLFGPRSRDAIRRRAIDQG